MSDFTFPQIIKHFDLETDFQHVFKFNRSNYLPYHNLNHTMSMIVRAGKACKWFYGQSLPERFKTDVSAYRYWQDIFLSILYHDFNHSGGLNNDDDNVMIAEAEMFENDRTLIRFTKYPYENLYLGMVIKVGTNNNYVLTEQHIEQIKIIRDCDLTQWAEEDWFYQTFLGLFREFGFKNNQVLDAIDKQIEFMTNLTFFTEWAKTDYAELRLKRIEQLKEYRGLFE